MNETVHIQADDYWFKVVEFLQTNWALIEPSTAGVLLYFIQDTSGVFDEMTFSSADAATAALYRNGFRRFAADPTAASFLRPPSPPLSRRPHPNGPIYSSGRFWRSETR